MSEGVCEAPTFMEWSRMVVPTYPEGGSHALQVCQHHHQVVRVGNFVGLSEIGGTPHALLATAPADSAETFTVSQRTVRSILVAPRTVDFRAIEIDFQEAVSRFLNVPGKSRLRGPTVCQQISKCAREIQRFRCQYWVT